MNESGPRMLWRLCGSPPVTGSTAAHLADHAAVCAMCGETRPRTAPTAKAIGGNFTDQYLISRPDSDRVCDGCLWVCAGKPPATVRMWTAVCREDAPAPPSHPKSAAFGNGEHVHFTARNDMRWVVATLADPPDGPWLVTVAESGQKHHAPYARVNSGTGAWTVRMDAADVTAEPAEFARLFAAVVALRRAGFRTAEIETGQPAVGALTAERLAAWRRLSPAVAAHRGSPLLHLTAFLPNKEHLDFYATAYPA